VTPFAGQRDRVGTGANLGRRVHGGIPRGSRRGVPSPGRHLPRRRPISEARPNDRRCIGFFAPNLTKPKDYFVGLSLTDPDACTGLRPREAISPSPRPRPGFPRDQGGRGVRPVRAERCGQDDLPPGPLRTDAARPGVGHRMGERQRTELARVMLSTARMLFLDEPFSNVDVSMRIGLRSILREWVSRGGSILFTSHNLLESEAIVDRYAFLHLGRIIALGTAR